MKNWLEDLKKEKERRIKEEETRKKQIEDEQGKYERARQKEQDDAIRAIRDLCEQSQVEKHLLTLADNLRGHPDYNSVYLYRKGDGLENSLKGRLWPKETAQSKNVSPLRGNINFDGRVSAEKMTIDWQLNLSTEGEGWSQTYKQIEAQISRSGLFINRVPVIPVDEIETQKAILAGLAHPIHRSPEMNE